MADIEYTDAVAGDDSVPATGGLGRLVNLAGALASILLIAGICVWGYKLWVRDVTGVPVVRALEGPMRVAPQDPGGEPADHQGLAVNAVAAQGTAAPVADRILLAPGAVELTEEDTPMAGDTPSAQAARPEELTNASVEALVQQLISGSEPVAEPVAESETQPEESASPEPVAAEGLTRSLRPRARPETLASVMAEDLEEGDTLRFQGTVKEMEADAVPLGSKLAQLGAFDSEETARGEWDKLNLRFGDYLGDKTRVVQKATSGGRTFYRLRAMGFEDIADARRFCAVLAAEKAECIPVTLR